MADREIAQAEIAELANTVQDRTYEKGKDVALRSEDDAVASASGVSHKLLTPGEHDCDAKSSQPNSFHHQAGDRDGEASSFSRMDVAIPTTEAMARSKNSCALGSVGERTLGQCGPLMLQKLLEVLPFCSQTTGKDDKHSLFPLPTSRSLILGECDSLSDDEVSWVIAVCLSLNSYWGSTLLCETRRNDVQMRCMSMIVGEVQRFCHMSEKCNELDWSTFFSVRTIDYRGEEVRVAQYFSWANISPALPREIGVVPLEDLCQHGAQHYVKNFDLYLKPQSEWIPPTRPRVMVKDEHWDDVCRGLLYAHSSMQRKSSRLLVVCYSTGFLVCLRMRQPVMGLIFIASL